MGTCEGSVLQHWKFQRRKRNWILGTLDSFVGGNQANYNYRRHFYYDYYNHHHNNHYNHNYYHINYNCTSRKAQKKKVDLAIFLEFIYLEIHPDFTINKYTIQTAIAIRRRKCCIRKILIK